MNNAMSDAMSDAMSHTPNNATRSSVSTSLQRVATSWLALLVFGLVACSGVERNIRSQDDASTLGELPAAYIPPKQKVDDSSLDIVAAGYKDALALISDQTMQEDILRRLAMIELRYAEGRQVKESAATQEAIYANAIATYKMLINTQQYRKDNDKLLYPLAKAYEFSGDMQSALKTFDRLVEEFPESSYYSESQFRRGEILFSDADYEAASQAYHAIVQRNLRDESLPDHVPSSFLVNAYYMWGWTDFKLERHQQALRAFIVVLDEYTQKAIAGYGTRSSDELLQDTFRVMALSFSYTEGAQTIAALLDEIDERPYSDRLFAELGNLYLNKKRYRDSAAVFSRFVERYPQSPLAPEFHQRQIDAFTAGRFPEEVREQKRKFAANYAVDGIFWRGAPDETQLFIKSKLTVYLAELASYHHNLAQKSKADWRTKGALAQNLVAVQQHFRDASVWYKEWIRSFPGAPDLPEKYFLLGETQFEATDYAPAVSAYEMAAYGFDYGAHYASSDAYTPHEESTVGGSSPKTDLPDCNTGPDQNECVVENKLFSKANEAGYAALLAYDYLIDAAPEALSDTGPQLTSDSQFGDATRAASEDSAAPTMQANPTGIASKLEWREKKIESALLFAENFLLDKRRHKVLAQTTTSLLELQQYTRTIEVAALLTGAADVDAVERELLFSTWLASAHAQTALQSHAEAEGAYQHALLALGSDTTQPLHQQYFQKTLDNYAASIYRQGELANSAGDPLLAANTFLRVVELAPASAIRVTAQHDASVLLMQVQQWQAAIDVITDFQQRFPTHSATQTAAARLLEANQQLQNWGAAALQALAMADQDADSEVRRQALYSAAEFFEKDHDTGNALLTYERYAHSYSQPLAELMEAQYKLVELYRQRGDTGQRQFWLAQLEAAHIAAPNKTDRSRYLAALASADLAERQLHSYQAIKLNIPLKASLAKKRQAMQVALAAFEKTADYGVAEYTTLASQRMGEIYAGFASELMDSERPRNLSELELEQYSFLLEEQAYPFEEQAIEFFTVNVQRAWQGTRTPAVKDTYKALAKLLPARFDKAEMRPSR